MTSYVTACDFALYNYFYLICQGLGFTKRHKPVQECFPIIKCASQGNGYLCVTVMSTLNMLVLLLQVAIFSKCKGAIYISSTYIARAQMNSEF